MNIDFNRAKFLVCVMFICVGKLFVFLFYRSSVVFLAISKARGRVILPV